MAVTRKSSSGKSTQTLQVLYKERWLPTKSGGQYMKWELDVSGDNLVRPATIEEVVPGAHLYMRDVYKVNEFRPTVFSHLISWDSIKELFGTGRIYIKNTYGNKG